MRILVGSNHPLAATTGAKDGAKAVQVEIAVFPECELYGPAVELHPEAIVVSLGQAEEAVLGISSTDPGLALLQGD